MQTQSAPDTITASPFVARGMYDCKKLKLIFCLLRPLKARAPPWYFLPIMQSCITQVLLPLLEFPRAVKIPWSCRLALATWCWQLGSIGSCMGGSSYGAICLLLLAFAPFELIVPPSTLTSLRPLTHPLDGNAAPPQRRRPPSPTTPPDDSAPSQRGPPS